MQPVQNESLYNKLVRGDTHALEETIGDEDASARTEIADAFAEACFRGDSKILELLLSFNCSPNFINRNGQSPLHVAAESLKEIFVSKLLNSGANPNLKDNYGQTPLFIAIDAEVELAKYVADQEGKPSEAEIIVSKLLLDAGADPFIATFQDVSPYQLALEIQHKKIIELIERRYKIS